MLTTNEQIVMIEKEIMLEMIFFSSQSLNSHLVVFTASRYAFTRNVRSFKCCEYQSLRVRRKQRHWMNFPNVVTNLCLYYHNLFSNLFRKLQRRANETMENKLIIKRGEKKNLNGNVTDFFFTATYQKI